MIKKILKWFKENSKWHKEHIEAWKGKIEVDSSGFSEFQKECLDTFKQQVRKDGIEVAKVDGTSEHENYYTGKLINEKLTFYIYSNSVQLYEQKNCVLDFEDWDFRTPEEMIKEFVKRCLEANESSENV